MRVKKIFCLALFTLLLTIFINLSTEVNAKNMGIFLAGSPCKYGQAEYLPFEYSRQPVQEHTWTYSHLFIANSNKILVEVFDPEYTYDIELYYCDPNGKATKIESKSFKKNDYVNTVFHKNIQKGKNYYIRFRWSNFWNNADDYISVIISSVNNE